MIVVEDMPPATGRCHICDRPSSAKRINPIGVLECPCGASLE